MFLIGVRQVVLCAADLLSTLTFIGVTCGVEFHLNRPPRSLEC